VELDRAGPSLRTDDLLRFQADQARARDAVHRPFDLEATIAALRARGRTPIVVRSQARSLQEHLIRPDLGRRAHAEDLARLAGRADLLVVVSDGLSSGAAERYAPRLVAAMDAEATVVVVPFGRVAIADEIGEALGAEVSVILLGERPGLTAPESLGAYVTYRPHRGRTDADRVCLSNIRDEGLPPEVAAIRLNETLSRARIARGTGVAFPASTSTVLE
jgi:ethanolamine ammonia-lyase small subunit